MNFKEINLKFEWVYLFLSLVFGLLFVFANPPFQSNDEDRHFLNSYKYSKFQFTPESENGFLGMYLPVKMTEMIDDFMSFSFKDSDKVSKTYLNKMQKEGLWKEKTRFLRSTGTPIPPIAYIPSSIAIAAGSLTEENPLWLLWFGRIGGLAGFVVIIFFALRIIPFFKGFIFLWGLTPMVLYQAASVTYDTMNNALSVLIVALIFYYAFEKPKLERNDYILLVVLALLNIYCKAHTLLIPMLYFIIPGEKRAGRYMSVLLAVIFVLFYFLPAYTWSAYINSFHLKAMRLQKDFYFNGGLSLKYHLSHPFNFLYDIIANIATQAREWLSGTISRFGWKYLKLPDWLIAFHSLVLIFTAFFESNKKIIMTLKQKAMILTIGIATSLIIILGMFILGSPVGTDRIFGLQGRYFIPALPLLFIMLYNNNFEFRKWEKYKIWYLSGYVIFLLSYTVIFINNYFYQP